jgi:hypothetical protein
VYALINLKCKTSIGVTAPNANSRINLEAYNKNISRVECELSTELNPNSRSKNPLTMVGLQLDLKLSTSSFDINRICNSEIS